MGKVKYLKLFLGLSILLTTSIGSCFCQRSWTITDYLDEHYVITRKVDLDKSEVAFHVTAKTNGFVGFGLSENGGMRGADIVIGGISDQGKPYFKDYHSIDNSQPIEDLINNWSLEEAKQNETHTELYFSRKFDTCDNEDVPITEDTISLIWAIGHSDDIEYHGQHKGTLRANLLDPPMKSLTPDNSEFLQWNVNVNDKMRSADTSYMCSIHPAPNFSKKHHIVGFEARLNNDAALKHTHHFNVWKCTVPYGMETDFENRVGEEAFDCTSQIPHPVYPYCQKHLYVWAKGGHRTMFPDHVGLELVDRPGTKEYYMLEIHYDNPTKISNLRFQTGLTIFHTEELRPNTAGILVIGHLVSFRHTIPPMSTNFLTVGHCTRECLQSSLPPNGINVFNILLHSHLSGRKLKLRQFRDGKELPWFAVDNNYDFNFQQNRPFSVEKKILRGDHLTYECTTDTTWKTDKSVTFAGLSTKDEMCETFLLYYPKMHMDYCASSYPMKNLLQDFGIEGFVGLNSSTNFNNPIITGPKNMRGRNYTEVLTKFVDWTPKLRSDFQNRVVHSDHEAFCAVSRNAGLEVKGITKYPNVQNYVKPNHCTTASGATAFKSIVNLVLIPVISFQAVLKQMAMSL